MTGRGRAKRALLPNVAAAGRSAPPTPAQNAADGPRRGDSAGRRGRGGNRGRGRGRGARGAGRGRGAPREEIIQNEGIFTDGVAAATRIVNRPMQNGTEQIIGKVEGLSRATKEAAVDGATEPSAGGRQRIDSSEEVVEERITYETEWQSDEELDKEDYAVALNDECLEGLRPGRVAPVVLPDRDTPQFDSLVRRPKQKDVKMPTVKVKQEWPLDETMEEPATLPMEVDTKAELVGEGSRRTMVAESLHKPLPENSNFSTRLLSLQLPADLELSDPILKTLIPEPMDATPSTSASVDNEKTAGEAKPANKADEPADRPKHCLDGVPADVKIGQLEVLQSGKVRLVIGERVMDLHPAIPSGLHEKIVHIKTNNPPPSAIDEQNGQSDQSATMTVLGDIAESMVCTYNVAWT